MNLSSSLPPDSISARVSAPTSWPVSMHFRDALGAGGGTHHGGSFDAIAGYQAMSNRAALLTHPQNPYLGRTDACRIAGQMILDRFHARRVLGGDS